MRGLAKELAALSAEVSTKIQDVMGDVANSHANLNEMVNIDTSGNIAVKEKLAPIVKSIRENSENIASLMQENAENSRQSANDMLAIIHKMGFSALAVQEIGDIGRILKIIMEETDYHKKHAILSLGIKTSNSDVDTKLVDKVLSAFTLSQIKGDFIAYLIKEGYMPNGIRIGHKEPDAE